VKDPSNAQIEYAVVDAYAHLQCYRKLMTMPYIYPAEVPPPGSMADIAVGNRVFLYSSNKKNVVATGTFMGQAEKMNMFGKEATIKGHAKIRVMEDEVRIPGALIKVPTKSNHKAFLVLFDEAGKKQEIGILVPWKLVRVQIFVTALSQPNKPAGISMKIVSVPIILNAEPQEVDDGTIQKAAKKGGVTIGPKEACNDA
jgi:hypothetical protein